jgi:hypothetical protein
MTDQPSADARGRMHRIERQMPDDDARAFLRDQRWHTRPPVRM